jgi:hypothetical protein
VLAILEETVHRPALRGFRQSPQFKTVEDMASLRTRLFSLFSTFYANASIFKLLFSTLRQFRPLRSMGAATPYHTNSAPGIRTGSHFAPPNSAATPNSMRTMVQLMDFFDCALTSVSFRGIPCE